MANILELCSEESRNRLQSVKDEIETTRKKEEEEWKRERLKRHVFSSYEEALDWCAENPDKWVEWHSKQLAYQTDMAKFKSYEQEYDISGVMCYNVIKYYTREELLKDISEHIKHCNEVYPNNADKKWWVNECGKLEYVSILP